MEVPEDILVTLEAYPQAKSLFENLAPSHQREYIRWIDEAKKVETRSKRIAKMLSMLNQTDRQTPPL